MAIISRFKFTFLLPYYVFLQGCSPVHIGYIEPQDGPTSNFRTSIDIKKFRYDYNIPVYIHNDACEIPSNSLIGLLHSKTIGIPFSEKLEFKVPANQIVSISMQGIAKISYRELDVDKGERTTEYCSHILDVFTNENSIYDIVLDYESGKCIYSVTENGTPIDQNEDKFSIRKNCNLPFRLGPKR